MTAKERWKDRDSAWKCAKDMARYFGPAIRLPWNAKVVLAYWRHAARLERPRTIRD